MSLAPDPAEQFAVISLVEQWLATTSVENPIVTSIDRDPDPDAIRWYVRIRGEEKVVTTVWFTVRERTLHIESYFLPAPEENAAAVYEYLLRTSGRMYSLRFSIGLEDAVYVTGLIPFAGLLAGGDRELDRLLGSVYAFTEETYPTAARMGFPRRFD
jgi:hypothetical protein